MVKLVNLWQKVNLTMHLYLQSNTVYDDNKLWCCLWRALCRTAILQPHLLKGQVTRKACAKAQIAEVYPMSNPGF